MALDSHFGAAEIGNRPLSDFNAAGIHARIHIDLPGFDTGDECPIDPERKRAFARPVETDVAEKRIGHGLDAIQVDFG